MKQNEYDIVKNLNYLQYCEYLQNKYGVGLCDYFTKSWSRNAKISRTNEGLFVHHKYEDHAIMLSTPNYAKENPFEWQTAKNMVYCDYLEHLYLHILICENPSPNKNKLDCVGIGGIINYIVPQLNDLYSGWVPKKAWLNSCFNLVKSDKDMYLTLLKRFKKTCSNYKFYTKDCLFTSENNGYGTWDINNNKPLFDEIMCL